MLHGFCGIRRATPPISLQQPRCRMAPGRVGGVGDGDLQVEVLAQDLLRDPARACAGVSNCQDIHKGGRKCRECGSRTFCGASACRDTSAAARCARHSPDGLLSSSPAPHCRASSPMRERKRRECHGQPTIALLIPTSRPSCTGRYSRRRTRCCSGTGSASSCRPGRHPPNPQRPGPQVALKRSC